MASSFPTVISNAGILIRALESEGAQFRRIYNEHCHRIYSLAFWMTDHELVAERVAANTFLRAFASSRLLSAEEIDQAFLAEICELVPLEGLTLQCDVSAESSRMSGNMKRAHLERAVVELPATEKMVFLLHDVEGYGHARIARLLNISEDDSRVGLHQARLWIREFVAQAQ
jgi:RNA polymerase sigma-70 factor (ECF subfamily)